MIHKNKHSVFLLPAFMLIFFSLPAQAAPPPSYPMVCKGGGNSELDLHTSKDGVTIAFRFKKNPGSATSGLAPGTCAWLDRPISAAEPGMVYMTLNGVYPQVSIIQNEGRLDQAAVRTRRNRRGKLKKIVDAFYKGTEFQLQVYYNPDGNRFIISKYGL